MNLQQTNFENNVAKKEIAYNEQFLLLSKMFQLYLNIILSFIENWPYVFKVVCCRFVICGKTIFSSTVSVPKVCCISKIYHMEKTCIHTFLYSENLDLTACTTVCNISSLSLHIIKFAPEVKGTLDSFTCHSNPSGRSDTNLVTKI